MPGTKSLGRALLGGCGSSGREARSPGAEDAACPFREKGCALWRKALEPYGRAALGVRELGALDEGEKPGP